MAQFSKEIATKLAGWFERNGYSLIAFNPAIEKSIYDEQRDKMFIDSKATIKGSKKNDIWDIYYTPYVDSVYDFENAFQFDNGVISMKNDNHFKLELVTKGSTFLDDEEYANDEYDIANEFANFDNFDSIDAPNYAEVYGDDPQVSVASPILNLEELTATQLKKAQEKLESSKNALAELKKAEKKEDIENAMWTFDEVDELYNSKITEDDKIAFFIYLQNKNRKKLTGDWANKYGASYPAEATQILSLMKKGCLFYDPTANLGERLQPRVIYKSGNVWSKYASLDNRKDEYIKRFGNEIYELHVKNLDWQTLNANRLQVRGEKDMRLQILPISAFAEDFKINGIVSPKDKETIKKNFQIYTSFTKDGLKQDLLKNDGRDSQYVDKRIVSLQEGFILWLKDAGTGNEASANGINWSSQTIDLEQLIDRYLKPVNNPFAQEAGGVDKWMRMKDDAKKVGDRLFAQFLDEGLIADDQVKLEFVWNSMYNAYVEPNLDEVPIGFTYKKYLDNRHLFVLKETNLRAVRYYLTRGSVGLAYGVGLGKTFCSIFAMKQALDLGTAKRPLVIVPNQVYFQFGQEIKRGLGKDFDPLENNSRLNMFYNGSGVYNLLGNTAVDGINLCTYEAVESFQFSKDNTDMAWVDEAINVLEMTGDITSAPIRKQNFDKYAPTLFDVSAIEDDADLSDEYQDTSTPAESSNDEDIDDLGDFEEGGTIPEPIYLNTDSTNYDMVVVDEAHNFNNLFSSVQGKPKEEQKETKNKKGKIRTERKKHNYGALRETKGASSSRAKKLWFLARFIQRYNYMGNTILLSATPFTNSPLQVFSMLSLLNYNALKKLDLNEIADFFDTFAKVEYAEDFKTDLSLVRRFKFTGFVNLIALQKLIYRFFDKSSREDEDKAVVRPNKWVLPLKRKMIDNKIIEFAKENYVSTTIRMSDLQLELWSDVRRYASPNPPSMRYEELFRPERQNTTRFGKYEARPERNEDDEEQEEVAVDDTDNLADGTEDEKKVKQSIKSLQCLMWGRQIALNPYLFKGSGFKVNPTPQMYIESSPKLLYVMECIRGIKEYHDKSKDSPRMSGQVIYMNSGTLAFELIRDYLVEELGFNINEIGIIRGNGNYIGKKKYASKQKVADAFLGREMDNETGQYTILNDSQRVKVLIGSESIKEGINLQDYASVLYNCYLDFNPTDQVQVEGRIWRQGNAFANVRIVTPLMADCIDVFMFQKLEDKTERINQIWTRNGNQNELDTTAFNPAELKYELLTDPVAIAILEIADEKTRLEEQKTIEGETLSSYLILSSTYRKGLRTLYPNLKNYEYDFRLQMYNRIFQFRPDLLTKPLASKEGYDKYISNLLSSLPSETRERYTFMNVENFKEEYNTPYRIWGSNYYISSLSPYNLIKQNESLLIWRESFDNIFNYSAEELINLMVKVLKEQKIAYPLGYTKNWRELLPEKEMPIVEGDEVEFDTKSGRKKGIAEYVLNRNNNPIYFDFWRSISYQYRNNETDKANIEEAIKRLNLKNLQPSIFDYNTTENDITEDVKKDLIALLKDFYKNNPNLIMTYESGEYQTNLIPVTLDVDDFERLNIQEKNIKVVQKEDKSKKKVVPAKYPEPFPYSSKEREENLKDIFAYIAEVEFAKSKEKYEDFHIYLKDFCFNEPKDLYTLYTTGTYMFSFYQMLINTSRRPEKQSLLDYDFQYLPKTWAEFIEKSKDARVSLFKQENYLLYSAELPLDIVDFKKAEEKKFIPMGINSFQDIENLIEAQKTKMNTFTLMQQKLNDPQVVQERVQEVERKQQELNSEEIRKGSSFKSRAELFGKPNSDYMGNNLLSIFTNTDQEALQKVQESVEEQVKEVPAIVEEQEVIVSKNEKAETQALIADLEELLEFSEESEKVATQSLIDDLKELLEFMD